MKKIYIIPDVKVVIVQPQLLTSASLTIGGETDVVESRRRGRHSWDEDDFWDEDEDEF